MAKLIAAIHQHMVAIGDLTVMKRAQKLRLTEDLDTCLFEYLPAQRIDGRFADLHAASGQLPSLLIAVAHEQDLLMVVKHNAASAECEWASEEEKQVKTLR